jgi:SHS2 domain-containing protein
LDYEFLEEHATADIAFRAGGESLDELFTAAAEAVLNVMVEELESIEPREKRRISLEKPELDLLLFAFLQELIYYKDAEGLLLRVPAVRIEEAGGWRLEAEAAGETIDPSRHRMWVDVKAITLHRFSLEETGRGWEPLSFSTFNPHFEPTPARPTFLSSTG